MNKSILLELADQQAGPIPGEDTVVCHAQPTNPDTQHLSVVSESSPASPGGPVRLTKHDRRLERAIVKALSSQSNVAKRPSSVDLAQRGQISLKTRAEQQRFVDALNRLLDQGIIAHDPTNIQQGFFCMPDEVHLIQGADISRRIRDRIIRPVR